MIPDAFGTQRLRLMPPMTRRRYCACMRRAENSPWTPPPSFDSDWAEAFLARGWRHKIPWVVIEQIWPSPRKFERLLSESRGGWGFEFVSFRVLHAPMFDVFASASATRGIIDAIRAYPARRAAQNAPLDGERFCSPVLLVTSQPGTDRYALAGAATSLDPIFASLVARGDVEIDQALELMILLTCHGKPGEAAVDKRNDGSSVSHRRAQKSAFLQPFHPRRFRQVMSALRARTAGDSLDERRAELYRLLSASVRDVVASLRKNPPPSGKELHSVARSRLVELVSAELGLLRSRAARIPWWRTLDDWTESERRSFLRSLTAAQRAAVRAARRGKSKTGGPSTPRVLLARAKVKFDNALRERRRKST